jgi:putative NADH-flavin reductase
MKLTIFGASGRTGIPLVEQALVAGHQVTAFVRSPAKFPLQHEHLTVIQGDVLDSVAVAQAIVGADAVLSVLGHTQGSPKTMQTQGIQHIIAAMRQQGVRRLVSLTGAGIRAPQDRPKLVDHLIGFLLKTLARDVAADAAAHVEAIRQSGLDWVVVRGPRFTDGPHTGHYRVGWVGVNTGTMVTRAHLADFMLKQVTDNTYLHQMPMVSD